MLRSMFTAVSGLRNHQVRMDVVANNIANINTIGFKRSRVNFQDILSQTIQGASTPTTNLGGTNPQQVGLGMTVSSIDTVFTQGNLQLTGVNTDMAIQGNGMFILHDANGNEYYTRAGTFTLDGNGMLVNSSNGYKVQGWMADSSGNINTSSSVEDIIIHTGTPIAPNATTQMTFEGNLDSTTYGTLSANSYTQTVTDSVNGTVATITWTFTPTGNFGEWTVRGVLSGSTNPTWAFTGTSTDPATLEYTIQVQDRDDSVAGWNEGDVIFDTAPGATDTINFNDGLGSTATVNLIDTGDNMKDSTADITVAAPDTGNDITMSYTPSETHTTSINVYDDLGNAHTITLTFTHDPTPGNNNIWNWVASGTEVDTLNPGDGTLTFNSNGTISNSTINNPIRVNVSPATSPLLIGTSPSDLDFTSVTQYAADSSLIVASQDGYASGTLTSFTVGNTGIITGIYSNGLTQDLAQVALAKFSNYEGLQKEGDNLFSATVNSLPSGRTEPDRLPANTNGLGSISAGMLEMSNVDIAQEFVDMITAERGFQVNSRSITTSDEILQEVINLKR